MITCNICGKTCRNTFAHARHMRTHSCLPNASFKCGFPECTRTFSKFSAFRFHTHRHKYVKSVTKLDNAGDLTCNVDLCSIKCDDIRGLLLHLKSHITDGKTVSCPFRHCDKAFTVKSTFTSHVSRKHKDYTEGSLVESDISVLRALELSTEECGQCIEKYLRTKLKNKAGQSEDGELTLCIIQLLMAYSDEKTEGLMLFADMSATAANVERTLTLPASPRLILLVAGDGVTLGRWVISIESQVICEGAQKSFIAGLAVVFAAFYVFNLQYQEEAARTLEFVQRRLIVINPERGSKTGQGRVVSKKTEKLVHKKATTVNLHVATPLKNLMDFEWGFI